MKNIFEGREFESFCVGAGVLGALMIAATSGITTYSIKKVDADRLKAMPDSYWAAEKAKAEADVKKHEIDIALKERLTLDSRERAQREAEAKREFERSAPPEYWQMLSAKAEAEARSNAEKASAQAQAEAITKAAREIRYAINNQ